MTDEMYAHVPWEDAPLGTTLWGVYGSDCAPTIFAFQLNDGTAFGRAMWGFSIYKRKPGFRTFGTSKKWAEEHGLKIFLSPAAAFSHIQSLFSRISEVPNIAPMRIIPGVTDT